ncbi:hypothetical protein [Chryseobacterium endalhagicum]|uniref:hypothetical protein n=1 Tax=Chryseobacterium endalhagicum TaxID=2797638 RepID=UPI001E5F669A|nr:hypothetical protein [Chryseobacterium endalhagicum]
MKKNLTIIGSFIFGTLFSQDIPFDKLYGNGDPVNYHITHYAVSGSDGLDINWYGGIRLQTTAGILQLLRNGNVGIGTHDPVWKLDVNGDSRFRDIISGGSNSWVFHTPDDNRKSLYIAPRNSADTNWEWDKSFLINGENGNALLNGKFEAKEVKVTLTPTADFVFDENYTLPKLEDVEKHIKEKKHLPEIASADIMKKEGVNIGQFQIKLLQKIEELTLYSIEQNKKLKTQSEKLEKLEQQVEKLLSEKK